MEPRPFVTKREALIAAGALAIGIGSGLLSGILWAKPQPLTQTERVQILESLQTIENTEPSELTEEDRLKILESLGNQ